MKGISLIHFNVTRIVLYADFQVWNTFGSVPSKNDLEPKLKLILDPQRSASNLERGSQRPTPIKSIIDSYQGIFSAWKLLFFDCNCSGPRKIPPHLDRHGTAQSHLSAISAQTLNPVLTSGPAANLDREKSFVSDASFARQETRGSLTSIREEDQRKKSERSGSLAPNKPAISESLKAEVNYIKVDFTFSFLNA